jgi:GNAT superfamily N-acetyltransferase
LIVIKARPDGAPISVIEISPAGPGDAAAIAELLDEMDRFYGGAGSDPVEARIQQVSEAHFGTVPAAWALLARDGGQVAGIASWSYLWPAVSLTRSLYLKELYVAERHRRCGVGRLLMQAVFEAAREQKCSHVEWTTDTDNTDGLAFYRQLGLPVHSSKVFYQVEGAGTGIPPVL